MTKPPKAPPPRKPRRKAPDPAEASPRIARRERRRERSREEIVDAARRVLLRSGIAATTLDAVAKEVGLTKAALYYYYPSKDALFFDTVFGAFETQSRAIRRRGRGGEGRRRRGAARHHPRDGVELRGAPGRLPPTFLHSQLAGPGAIHVSAEQFARIRPINDLAFAGAVRLLSEDWKQARGRARVEPRLMAFLANIAAIGLLTMKGMVENIGDPLLYSDEQMIEALARIFESAAAPKGRAGQRAPGPGLSVPDARRAMRRGWPRRSKPRGSGARRTRRRRGRTR